MFEAIVVIWVDWYSKIRKCEFAPCNNLKSALNQWTDWGKPISESWEWRAEIKIRTNSN